MTTNGGTDTMTGFVLCRAVLVALVVGPLLTLINQYDAIFGEASFFWGRFALTTMVPFCVSSLSGTWAASIASAKILEEQKEHAQAFNTVATENDELSKAVVDYKHKVETLEQEHLADRNRTMVIEGVTAIRGNARKVNESSIERVQFISGLIGRFEEINQGVSQLQQDATRTSGALDVVARGSADVSEGMTGMVDDAMKLSQNIAGFPQLREAVDTQFDAVKLAAGGVSDLAAQIRLLAINASVEAANVGDAGRGFGVIALEVRELADRASRDVGHIEHVLGALGETHDQMVGQMERIEGVITESRARADVCRETTTTSGQHIDELNREMRRFSDDITSQLPRIMTLIDGVRQIKQNTEAAVYGSARNVALCDDVLSELGGSEKTKALPGVA